jgi:TatD DNase family protein
VIPHVDIHTHSARPSDASCRVVTNFLQKDEDWNLKIGEHTEGGKMASVGLHPYYLTKENANSDLEKLTQVIKSHNIVAIGECGLDRLRGEDLDFQTRIFEQQIRLAESVNKPVVIHCVRAFNELMVVQKKMRPKVPLIIHGFNKNDNILRGVLAHDFYISIGAAILRGGKNFQKTVAAIPNDRFFLETDDATEPIETIYEAVAAARSIALNDLKSIVYDNFNRLFLNGR